MSIDVRAATLDDTEQIRVLGHEVWPVAYAGMVTPEFMAEGLATGVGGGGRARITDGITLVAVDNGPDETGRIVGMTGLGQENGEWVMWKLYIRPEHHGGGIGRRLVEGAIAALPAGTKRLLLDVLVANEAAIGFYHRLGFTETEDGTGRDLGPDLIWMSLDLDRT